MTALVARDPLLFSPLFLFFRRRPSYRERHLRRSFRYGESSRNHFAFFSRRCFCDSGECDRRASVKLKELLFTCEIRLQTLSFDGQLSNEHFHSFAILWNILNETADYFAITSISGRIYVAAALLIQTVTRPRLETEDPGEAELLSRRNSWPRWRGCSRRRTTPTPSFARSLRPGCP